MIIHGQRRVPKTQQLSEPIECPHCLQIVPILVVACVEYFHLFWIPLFGAKSGAYICSSCQKTLTPGGAYEGEKAVVVPSEAQAILKELKKEIRVPWYYFFGLIFIAGAILFGLLSSWIA